MGYRGHEIATVLFVIFGLAAVGLAAIAYFAGRYLDLW